ncbi:uncharacterized protein [Arachis hypogaea]|uniref:uncharacterized protein n=1 Tax=Arachis hypogaea TaxID=3818 RepID=UPI003B21AE6E
MREFFAFRIQKIADGSPLLYSRRLFQQFLVDGYSMIESSRLNYIRSDQEKLRCEMYKGVKEAVLNGETTPSSCGKRIILPSSFTGGPRYMIQNYQDAMAICKVVGYPDLFITFTCNPKWPEVEDFLNNRELNPQDRPDIICRVFKAKLDTLIKDVRANKVFGRVAADIDKIISAEIPDKKIDPEYFDAVEKHMMHGPCGVARKDSPCMENSKCIRHFPKKFVENTTIDDDGYPVYRRREDGKTINKSGVDLDNRHDRVTASFYKSAADKENMDDYDEVSMYYDCRYISPCEAAWRIFGYNIHYRDPSVVRLGFHLPDEQNLIFKDNEKLDDVIREASVKESMFLGWFQANKIYSEARSLTFAEFPTHFVWKAKERVWLPRKSHAVIGRIFFVPPGSGERYYLRLLLNCVRGPTCYEDIRTIDGVVYSSFKDACYARGLLDDDKEYVEAIVEASYWAQRRLLDNQGKTFVWKTLASALRSRSHIVLTVASSGIASLLLPGGRTAHSRFAIPLNIDEFSTCNIKQGSALAELLIKTKLIIWDEAPMVNRFCIEALDRTMRDILRFNNKDSLEQPFGGKTIVFGGDFRQILPVIPKGSRQEIVNATINSSYLWDDCKLLTLSKNMRLKSSDLNSSHLS